MKAFWILITMQLVSTSLWAQAPINTPDNTGAGNCLDFNGTSDYVSIADSPTMDVTGSLTIEAWINPGKISGSHQYFISKYHSVPTASYTFILQSNSELQFFITRDGVNHMYATTTTTPLNANEWAHVAGVFDATVPSMKIYVNGVEQATSVVGSETSIKNTSLSVGIGARVGSLPAGQFFQGQLDEVRIWNTARSLTQIRDNMNSKLGGSESNLAGYWNINEGSDNTCSGGEDVCDKTSNGNHGTLY